ncbi:long-chain fatty acid--CoA ligase [Amycolatopsis regifaucium]|uniref:Long-chain fatty acid--CoA ligase n=1 Tax=Amycolatopsis regifaucium TaxID=546365 RepID=A0A154MPH1_9PSEU|nr:long-chain fatty acid--CoA ligase [Amycolatopsis regifaucium]KZB85980.1 long-chain fatty acid--CoA ligase [Amycolatopsis regifaucium]OKA04870.1 long-chain fatty acid--CoA ligase [Amycolatopsis regifaucium]SFH73538.1 fatty-acyl-CoA synthase [Amycolatopsis regifaucium]
MHSTMPDTPLTIARILRYGTTVHASSRVSTWNGTGFDSRSYAEVGERAARLAHALRDRLGVRPGTRVGSEQGVVGTLMWNNTRHLELFVAVPAMGAVLHTLNWRMPADQLLYTIGHAGDEVIIVDAGLTESLAPVLARLPETVRHIIVAGHGGREALSGFTGEVHDYEELISDHPGDYPWEERLDERAAATICYTTGTTGKPKGVVYSHRSIFLHCLQVLSPSHYDMSPHDTLFPIASMFHVIGWGIPHTAFFTGADLLLPDRFTKAESLARMIDKGRPTFSAAVPTVWSSLLEELDTRTYDTESLRRAYVGGSACPPALMAAYRDRHSIELLHGWGMTETMGLVSAAVPPRGADADEEWAYRVSQGRFPPSVEFRLVGPDGALVPCDGVATGELQLRGPEVTCAYHGGDEAAWVRPAENFTADGWLRTGDVGAITANGYLRLTDRVKDVIKSGGEFISSVGLENTLMEHSAVIEAAVIAVPDDRWGERPLATVSLRHNGIDPAELRDFLAERLDAWMVPERWAVLPAVPKTSVGKYDKRAIRDQYVQGLLPIVRLGRHRGGHPALKQ